MNNEKVAKELLAVAKMLTAAPVSEEDLADLSSMKIYEIADIVRRDWRPVNYAAKPYLDAMGSLENIKDNYGMDSGKSIVSYFLSNASSWRGTIAKAVKNELKKRLK